MGYDIIRTESQVCLHAGYLCRMAGVGESYLRVAKSRARRSGCRATAWSTVRVRNVDYFYWQNLPLAVQERLPALDVLTAAAFDPETEIMELVRRARTEGYKSFISTYSAAGAALDGLCAAAALIAAARNHIEANGLPYSKSAFFRELAREISIVGLKYLPKSWRNLRDRIRRFSQGVPITELVKAKNLGNKNAIKYAGDDRITGQVVEMGASEKNYTAAHIFRKLRETCETIGQKAPSLRWVSGFLSKAAIKNLTQGRFGAGSRFNHRYRNYTPTVGAAMAGDCWQIDGTRVNIIDHKAVFTYNGKRETKHAFLYMVVVRDAMSGLPLGWDYCHAEDATAVKNALAMAVRRAGYLPFELRYDRFPGHATGDWAEIETLLRRTGVKITVTHKAEGKAEIERWFGTLQTVFMSESPMYYGEGIRSTRIWAHRSPEYVKRTREAALKAGFDFDAACREADGFLAAASNTPYSKYSRKRKNENRSPQQLHDQCPKSNTLKLSEQQYCRIFGLIKQLSPRNNMIQTEIDGATHYYALHDPSIMERFAGVKLSCCFDCEDTGKVHLFMDYDYLGTFSKFTPAQQYGQDTDMRAVGTMKQIGREARIERERKLSEMETRRRAAETGEQTAAAPTVPTSPAPEALLMLGGKVKKNVFDDAETAFMHETWNDEESDEAINGKNFLLTAL